MLAQTLPQSPLLYHYYECSRGPFVNLSDLPLIEAEQILTAIRRDLEGRVRCLFEAKGGCPRRAQPHYMTVGACAWLREWYVQGCELSIPISSFASDVISFTYGDTFPALRLHDGRPYRGQVYTLAELPALIEQYGLPQDWNGDGQYGPERYIEAQVWDDTPLQRYLETSSAPLTDA